MTAEKHTKWREGGDTAAREQNALHLGCHFQTKLEVDAQNSLRVKGRGGVPAERVLSFPLGQGDPLPVSGV